MSRAYRRARSSSTRLSWPRRPTGSASRSLFGTVTKLSQLTTLASGRPSSAPTSTSEWMPRMVRVMGAHVSEKEHIDRGVPREHADRPPAGADRGPPRRRRLALPLRNRAGGEPSSCLHERGTLWDPAVGVLQL